MSADQGFELHPLAAQDITGIWEYIAKDSPLATRRVREEILDGIRALTQFPHQGYRRPNLTSRPLRFYPVREFVIAYAPEKMPLLIVAVFHGRRSPRVMATISQRQGVTAPCRLPGQPTPASIPSIVRRTTLDLL